MAVLDADIQVVGLEVDLQGIDLEKDLWMVDLKVDLTQHSWFSTWTHEKCSSSGWFPSAP